LSIFLELLSLAKDQKENKKLTSVAESRLVELGKIQGKQYQVVSGLKAGKKLILSNILNLTDGIST
jgi:multidrug efflux pump subunit AcrA (membrane-fusion protein)